MSPSGRRGPYAKTVKVQERILEASTEAFGETGYHATTMKDVAERSGISERGLAHHFPSKAELLEAVLAHHYRKTAEALKGVTGGPAEILSAMVDYLSADASQPGLVELHSVLSAEAISPDHPAHHHYRTRYEGLRAYVTRLFTELADAGALATEMSPRELAASYVALSDGLQLQWLFDRDDVEPAATLHRFLESAIPSLRPSSVAPA